METIKQHSQEEVVEQDALMGQMQIRAQNFLSALLLINSPNFKVISFVRKEISTRDRSVKICYLLIVISVFSLSLRATATVITPEQIVTRHPTQTWRRVRRKSCSRMEKPAVWLWARWTQGRASLCSALHRHHR